MDKRAPSSSQVSVQQDISLEIKFPQSNGNALEQLTQKFILARSVNSFKNILGLYLWNFIRNTHIYSKRAALAEPYCLIS